MNATENASQSTATAEVGISDEFIVTTCDAHGVKVVGDLDSHRAYVEVAHDDDFGWVWHASGQIERTPFARAFDVLNGEEPWRCCAEMVIDPHGYWDH